MSALKPIYRNTRIIIVCLFLLISFYLTINKIYTSRSSIFNYESFSKKYSDSNNLKKRTVKVGLIDGLVDDKHSVFFKLANFNRKMIVATNYNQDTLHASSVLSVISQNFHSDKSYGIADPKYIEVYNAAVLSNGVCKQADLISAIEWCIDKQVEIINISIAFNTFSGEIESLIEKGRKQGIIFVFSNGNFDTTERQIESKENLFFIGATDDHFKKSMMNSNNNADFYFPGSKIKAIVNDLGEYANVKGTTYSTAIATGILVDKLQKAAVKEEINFTDLSKYLKSVEVINK